MGIFFSFLALFASPVIAQSIIAFGFTIEDRYLRHANYNIFKYLARGHAALRTQNRAPRKLISRNDVPHNM